MNARAPRVPAFMHLLLTNDDGYDNPFLHALARALMAAGHQLSIVAPLREQSWIGSAKSRHRPVRSAPADQGLGCPMWTVDGTPGDCVGIGLAHLLPNAGLSRPEAVVSGINVGYNASLGFILASGTLGGAWEGAVEGLPAMAFSQELPAETYGKLAEHGQAPSAELMAVVNTSAAHAARVVPASAAACPPFTVHNFNFPHPCRPDSEIRRTIPARVHVGQLFGPADEHGDHRFVYHAGRDISPAEPLTDRAALAAGFISHTIIDYTKLGT